MLAIQRFKNEMISGKEFEIDGKRRELSQDVERELSMLTIRR
jgi:hypothetical protein